MALNNIERRHQSIARASLTNGKLSDGDSICDECHGAGLRAGSSMSNPMVCDVCNGKGTLTPAHLQKKGATEMTTRELVKRNMRKNNSPYATNPTVARSIKCSPKQN